MSLSQPTATIAHVAIELRDSTESTAEGQGTSPGPDSSDTTIQANAAVATSTGEEYVDPGVFGAEGTLTTDSRAPTRDSDPTKNTVDPSSETTKGPPPGDTGPTTTTTTTSTSTSKRVPPTPPKVPPVVVVPAVDDSDTDDAGTAITYDFSETTAGTTPAQVEATATTSAATATTTSVRAGPGGPPKVSSVVVVQQSTEKVDLGHDITSSATLDSSNPSQTTFLTSTSRHTGNETFTYIPSGYPSYCNAAEMTAASTSWSVTHTSTITWYGNPDDYTPPFPLIVLPTKTCVIPLTPPKLTISICASTGTGTKYVTCEVTTTTESYNFGIQTTTAPPVVFLTTDKNPAVVYSTIQTPNYGVSQDPKTRDNHATATSGASISTPIYNSDTPQSAVTTSPTQQTTPAPVTVAVQPTAVVINGNTIKDNPGQPTQVVIIAGETFTIDPTRVVGGGATIDRPSATGGIYVPTPTTTTLGNIAVVVSSSIAVIGGSSFTLGPSTTIATISGQTFTIGPSTIAAASQTLAVPTLPSPTEVVVAGGDLITAIGASVLVIHGTTLTYSTSTLLTLDGETITLGPGGVTLPAHDSAAPVTLGGTHASSPHDTQYALVGGATLTKIGASVVVVGHVSYTLGAGAGTTTTVVDGATVTLGPSAVVVGTMTLGVPFGLTTVITPGAGAGSAAATSTGGTAGMGSGAEEDAAAGLRPWLLGVVWGLVVAGVVGVI